MNPARGLTAAGLNRDRRVSDDRDCLDAADFDSGFATVVTLLCDLRYPHWLHHDAQTGIWWTLQVPEDVPAMPEPTTTAASWRP